MAAVLALGLLTSRVPAQEAASFSLDDFEGDVAARWRDVGGGPGPTLEPDDKTVKEGKQSGRWDLAAAAPQIYLARPGLPTDWTAWGALEMWVHSARPTATVFALVLGSENPDTEGEDYYRSLVPVDWEGWRLLHLEPRSFCPARRPVGWRQIDSLRLAVSGWSDLKLVPGTVLRFDALQLAKPRRDPERLVLFEPDTDWCAWWPLGFATTPTKTGRRVSEWMPGPKQERVVNRSVPGNWSGSTHFNAWLHCEGLRDAALTLTASSDNPETPEADGYEASCKTDWDGWRLLSLPLSDFRRRGEPVGWQAVSDLALSLPAPGAPEARLCLDRMWLSLRAEDEASATGGAGGAATPIGVAPTITSPSGTPPADRQATARLLEEGLAAKRARKLELAFTKYVGALLLDPRCVEAHWGLAWVLAAKGEKEAAREHFAKVAELSSDPKQVREAKEALARLK